MGECEKRLPHASGRECLEIDIAIGGRFHDLTEITPNAIGWHLLRRAAATVEGKVVSSAVDSTIKLACTGVAHKARAALSSLSGQRHVAAGAAFGGQRASVECGTSAPSDQHLFQPDHIVTQMSELLMQRANNDSWSPSIMAMQHAAKVP